MFAWKSMMTFNQKTSKKAWSRRICTDRGQDINGDVIVEMTGRMQRRKISKEIVRGSVRERRKRKERREGGVVEGRERSQ